MIQNLWIWYERQKKYKSSLLSFIYSFHCINNYVKKDISNIIYLNIFSEKPLLTWPSKIWGTRNLRCVRWSRSRPCVFYVLDDQSQLYTFDILEGDAMPAKMETLSKEK